MEIECSYNTEMDIIRPYKPSDRNALRQLAFDTADAGGPSQFPDFRLQVDLLTRYYTEHEPGSIWVLERNGHVAGYLTGCLDTKNFLTWLRFRGNVLTVFHVLVRNFYRPAIWKWARARMRTLKEGGAHREPWVTDYPAHLHLNLAKEARGSGFGRKLLETFVAQCRAVGVRGVHLATRGDNAAAQKFFEQNQFSPIATINAYRSATGGLEPVPVLILGRKLL
jgi:ribosomal protein S18 acetylase RimI-like enzyme